LPHNVAASPAQPQRALAHLVEWTHASPCRTRVEICVERQCAICAQMVLHKGCPWVVVPIAEFRDAERRARRAAAAAEGECAVCDSDTDDADADAPPRNEPRRLGVYRRGPVLLRVLPGRRSRPLLINPRERPCELCGTREPAHAETCPCVNAESLPEWQE
jgi:hypothetical protein